MSDETRQKFNGLVLLLESGETRQHFTSNLKIDFNHAFAPFSHAFRLMLLFLRYCRGSPPDVFLGKGVLKT